MKKIIIAAAAMSMIAGVASATDRTSLTPNQVDAPSELPTFHNYYTIQEDLYDTHVESGANEAIECGYLLDVDSLFQSQFDACQLSSAIQEIREATPVNIGVFADFLEGDYSPAATRNLVRNFEALVQMGMDLESGGDAVSAAEFRDYVEAKDDFIGAYADFGNGALRTHFTAYANDTMTLDAFSNAIVGYVNMVITSAAAYAIVDEGETALVEIE